ncbi:Grx4 family monothiol glutaredoxin [Haliangium sp.]|uniref:Grx4 family monothiol glutaredoxin n=1 Tax=Haliangium sp. TaxID=2663208 RepID=UPI003D0C4AFF
MSLSQDVRQRIESIITSDDVVLFMKGNRTFPQCGFSSQVVQILNTMVPEYTTVNVLADPEIRQGIKAFSDWPTIPQLYVRGEFVGGCDIVRDMFDSGELAQLMGTPAEVEPPSITITEAAAAALEAALKADGNDGDVIHLAIDAGFQHSLDIGPRTSRGVEVKAAGVTLEVEAMSARRAAGLVIDYVTEGLQEGFKIENPNKPADVQQLTPEELAAMLKGGEVKVLIDVRTERERELARIEGSRLLDDETMSYLATLAPDTPIVFYCHHGHRSQSAAEHFRDKGFRKLYNLAGGIEAWSAAVDPSVPRY